MAVRLAHVYAVQPSRSDNLRRRLWVERDAECTRKIVRGAERDDAQRQPGRDQPRR